MEKIIKNPYPVGILFDSEHNLYSDKKTKTVTADVKKEMKTVESSELAELTGDVILDAEKKAKRKRPAKKGK